MGTSRVGSAPADHHWDRKLRQAGAWPTQLLDVHIPLLLDLAKTEPSMAHLVLLRGGMGAGKSVVAQRLRELRSATLKVIEIDDNKRGKFGTTEKCNPAVDFAEGGRAAKSVLDKGLDVVVVEPLCDQSHVRLVLDPTGRSEQSPDVLTVWLDCTVETAIARKGATYQRLVIEDQHQRYPKRYQPRGELLIRTDHLSVAEIADEILKVIPS